MKKIFSTIVLSSLMLVFTACVDSSNTVDGEVNSANSSEPITNLNVMTTIPPLYAHVSSIVAGTNTIVKNIVPANASVHSFQLTPQITRDISDADVIVINGLELEHFLEDVLENTSATIVDTSENISAFTYEDAYHDDHADEDHDDDHDEDEHHHGAYDPHIWLDPDLAIEQVNTITENLAMMDLNNANIYQNNANSYINRLKNLKTDLQAQMDNLNVGDYIVFHDAYHYFEEAFGVESVAVFEPFPGKEPSAEYLRDIIDIIETENVTTIFTEPQFSAKLIDTISQDYDIQVLELDPLGTEMSNDGYIHLLQKNVNSFQQAFAN